MKAGGIGSGRRGGLLALAQVHAPLDVLAADGLLGRKPVVIGQRHERHITKLPDCAARVDP